jgi:hypothetical protein
MFNQWWSSAGSAGTVDVADTGKVVFANSVVQLPGIDLVVNQETQLAALPVVQTEAVIRYGVTPVEGVLTGQGIALGQGVALRLRYRDGSGRVVAVLIQVDIATGTETPTTSFDSEAASLTRSNAFQVNLPGLGNALDFANNAYYVKLTLTASSRPPVPILFPPKVSVIQLVPAQIE